ncbi:MAG: hypothetical protein AAF829_11125 [Pseudomonadota bacterium]
MRHYLNVVQLVALCVLAAVFVLFADAQPAIPLEDWEKRQNADERLTVFGDDIMGDAIDPHTGSIVFTHTDVSIPGNRQLQVALTRRLSQGFLYHHTVDAEFGNWELVVPRIKVTTIPDWDGDRCSDTFQQNFPNQGTGSGSSYVSITRDQYSEGVIMDIPGYSGQPLLENPNGAHWPSSATHVTTQNFYLYCGAASDGGEGFVAKAPNGDTYRFDKYIVHKAPPLNFSNGPGGNRSIQMLAATQVTDIHGNWVRYDYDGSGRLTRIYANDGREIDIIYQGSALLIDEVRANGRTWKYGYQQSNYRFKEWQRPPPWQQIPQQALDTVELPDGRSWSFGLDSLISEPAPAEDCPEANFSVSLVHPSGMTGNFVLQELEHRYVYANQLRRNQECPFFEPPAPGGSGHIYPLES